MKLMILDSIEKVANLKLEYDEGGDTVDVVVCDTEGKTELYLLGIRNDGTFQRYDSVKERAGKYPFKCDKEGRLLETTP